MKPQDYFRTWEELTNGERFDIMHGESPPSLRSATERLWRVVPDGWQCHYREDLRPAEIWACVKQRHGIQN
jgi:hypothetical protein